MSMIRNIQQSVQYRDIIKQAPDIVVYIDGQNYLINPYLGSSGVVVPFNDYITSWNASYDIDGMVPSCSISLSVPVQNDYLFRAPGGNNLLKSMSEFRVFAKGYYLSPRGNTLYHQVFKGFISSLAYAMDDKMVTISVSCRGSLAFMERMQIDQQPSTMSASPLQQTPLTANSSNLDPYQQIAWAFLYSSMIDGFLTESITAAVENKDNPYYQAITGGATGAPNSYVAKWQALLYDLARDAHIYGVQNVSQVIQSIRANVKSQDENNYDMEALGTRYDKVGLSKESDTVIDQSDVYDRLRVYMPEMGIGQLQLLNGQLTSRLERLRGIVAQIGFEAFQDVDGAIIVKPPLYNLDVVNLVSTSSPATDPNTFVSLIADDTNPFVLQLAEIKSEQEREDETAVRMTRVLARGSWSPLFQFNEGTGLPVAEDVDLGKLAQFGLRTEPPIEAHWIDGLDTAAIFAYATSEMARANRGLRMLEYTMPLRPELHLGVPMYIPHRDMYGYIRSISMNWTRGGGASTSVVLDTLRTRPLYAADEYAIVSGTTSLNTLLTPAPNLVLKWTKNNEAVTSNSATTQLASLPLPEQLAYGNVQKVISARKSGKLDYGANSDGPETCWRIQADTGNLFNAQRKVSRPAKNATPYVPGTDYYEDLRSVRPYTDDKGYTVTGVFPWGRWVSLVDSLNLFYVGDSLATSLVAAGADATAVSATVDELTAANAFLFTGTSSTEATGTATDAMNAEISLSALINNYKIFEITSDTATGVTTGVGTSSGVTSTLSASTPATASDADSTASTLASTMVSGANIDSLFQDILDSITTTSTTTAGN